MWKRIFSKPSVVILWVCLSACAEQLGNNQLAYQDSVSLDVKLAVLGGDSSGVRLALSFPEQSSEGRLVYLCRHERVEKCRSASGELLPLKPLTDASSTRSIYLTKYPLSSPGSQIVSLVGFDPNGTLSHLRLIRLVPGGQE